MKKNIILFLIGIGFSFSFVSTYAQDSSKTPIGFVKKVIRDVEDRPTVEDDWIESKPGNRIYNGHNVKTDIRSVAIVTYLDGSVLRVRPESEINIYGGKKQETNGMTTNTDITEGVVGFEVKKQSEDDEFIFTTPTGVASIRGTSGIITVLPSGGTLFTLLNGSAHLKAKGGLEESGDVNGGETGEIGNDGSVNVHKASDDETKGAENAQNETTKKFILETSEGKFEIEVLIDENSPLK